MSAQILMQNPAPITSLYAALLGLLFGVLSLRVALLRMKLGQSLGDKGQKPLIRAVRTHGNMAEYTPILLLLMLLLELGGVDATWVHGLGASATVGRVLHAVGLAMKYSANSLRRLGAVFGIGTVWVAAIRLLVLVVGG